MLFRLWGRKEQPDPANPRGLPAMGRLDEALIRELGGRVTDLTKAIETVARASSRAGQANDELAANVDRVSELAAENTRLITSAIRLLKELAGDADAESQRTTVRAEAGGEQAAAAVMAGERAITAGAMSDKIGQVLQLLDRAADTAGEAAIAAVSQSAHNQFEVVSQIAGTAPALFGDARELKRLVDALVSEGTTAFMV